MSHQGIKRDVEAFKSLCDTASRKLSAIDKRQIAIANLAKANQALKVNGAKQFRHLDKVWRRCMFPGVPCHCRLLLAVEDEYTDGAKKLTPFCTELKCDLTDSRASRL